jgi:hypothetical protein
MGLSRPQFSPATRALALEVASWVAATRLRCPGLWSDGTEVRARVSGHANAVKGLMLRGCLDFLRKSKTELNCIVLRTAAVEIGTGRFTQCLCVDFCAETDRRIP